ncbi:MAG: 6-carboxytetrahydropterin synthase [Halioglobus sp.]|nr:6-carboxytetrahydropterin synthase [Halioglobus sp.]
MAQLFVNELTVLDFSYLDRTRGVVGESWIVDIELTGELDDQGMLFDFGDVKRQIKRFIDTEADHRLLVPVESPGCRTHVRDDKVSVAFPLDSGGVISHQSPAEAVFLVPSATIDAVHIGNELQRQLQRSLPKNVSEAAITLRNEAIDSAYYHYTHGLQTHSGQCQRIAHGHRSRIEITIDNIRRQQHEAQWAERLRDCYIATEDHIVNTFELNGLCHTRLAYTAQQGDFVIALPSAQVFAIADASTVENIAIHIATTIAMDEPGHVAVKAFEGVGKGSLATAGPIENNLRR